MKKTSKDPETNWAWAVIVIMIVTALILVGLGFYIGYDRGKIDGENIGYHNGKLLRISDTFTPEQIEIQEGL